MWFLFFGGDLMCKRKKMTSEERSAKLDRLVNEFKKIAFIALFFVAVCFIAACVVAIFCNKTVPAAWVVTAFTLLFGDYAVYCYAATKEKDSLNKSGLKLSADGKVEKIVETVAKTVVEATTKLADK